MALSRYSKRTHDRLVAAIAETGNFVLAAEMVGVTDRTVRRWRKQFPELEVDLMAAHEDCIQTRGNQAESLMFRHLDRMEKDEEPFDLRAIQLMLARYDIRWTQKYRQEDVNVQNVAIEDALKEFLDEAAQSPR